jgi:glycosyltransferase involved in cell wall biosynthesis
MIERARRTSVILPACNDAAVVAPFVTRLAAAAPWHEILLVDDGSSDDTGARAAAAGARVMTHVATRGHGAAVKSGVREASGEYVVLADPAGPYEPEAACALVEELSEYELVVGIQSAPDGTSPATQGSRRLLNALASHLTGRPIPDLTSGLRAARRDCLNEFVHLIPNGPSTSTTTTLAFIKAGYSVRFVPLAPAPGREAAGRVHEAPFFLILLKVITIFSPLRIFVPASIATFGLGAGYALWTIATQSHVTNSSVLLILVSVVVFLIGLVSEQLAAVRFERPPA